MSTKKRMKKIIKKWLAAVDAEASMSTAISEARILVGKKKK